MADETTANYGWEKPDVGADDDTWGGILNDALDAIDGDLKGIEDRVAAVEDATGWVTLDEDAHTSAIFLDIELPAGYRRFHLILREIVPGGSGSDSLLTVQLSLNSGSSYIGLSPSWYSARGDSAVETGAQGGGVVLGQPYGFNNADHVFDVHIDTPQSGTRKTSVRSDGQGYMSGGAGYLLRYECGGLAGAGGRATNVRVRANLAWSCDWKLVGLP